MGALLRTSLEKGRGYLEDGVESWVSWALVMAGFLVTGAHQLHQSKNRQSVKNGAE
jgi:hypothetical protein